MDHARCVKHMRRVTHARLIRACDERLTTVCSCSSVLWIDNTQASERHRVSFLLYGLHAVNIQNIARQRVTPYGTSTQEPNYGNLSNMRDSRTFPLLPVLFSALSSVCVCILFG